MNRTIVYDGLLIVFILGIFVVSTCYFRREHMTINGYNKLILNVKSYIKQIDYTNILLVDDKDDTLNKGYIDVFGINDKKTMKKLRVYFDGNMEIDGHMFMHEETDNDDSLYTSNDLNVNIY